MSTPTILDRILAEKRLHIDRQREAFPIDLEKIERSDKPRGFLRALRARNQDGSAAVIAEIKKGRPRRESFEEITMWLRSLNLMTSMERLASHV